METLTLSRAALPVACRCGWLIAALTCAPFALGGPLDATERALVAHIAANQERFVTELEETVRIDSATQNLAGVRQLGAWYARELGALGFDTRWIELPPEMRRAGHLVAERRGTRGRRILLVGHLDTVLPGGAFRREGTRAFGSGVNDVKGGNLLLLHSLRALHASGALDDTQLTVFLTGDEEAPGDDLNLARRDLIEVAKRHDLALVFEGAYRNTVTIARRGIAFWALETQGATGHSAGIFSAHAGSGAVFEAARILNAFHEELRAEDGLTINPGLVVGGATAGIAGPDGSAMGKPNIIAQRVLVRGDLRFTSAEQLARVTTRMEAMAKKSRPRTSARLEFETRYPAMTATPESAALLAQLDEVSRDLGHGAVEACDPKIRGAGDVAFIAPYLPALDGLGPRGERAHAPDEDIDLASIPELTARTAVLLHRLTR